MGWKKLVILSLSFLCVSCLKFYHHPQGGFRPKKPDFSLDKEEFIYNNTIDTLAIYINIDTLKVEDLRIVSYLKFYNNGRYIKKSRNINKEINKTNLIPGFIGYYNTYNDTIKVEYYKVSALNKNDIKYVMLDGIIKGDTLIFKNRFVKEDKDIYIKQKLNFVPEPSNW